MLCFKYGRPDTLRFGMLARSELFFAAPDEVNDGSECQPRYVLAGPRELWVRLCYRLLSDAWLKAAGALPFDEATLASLVDLAEPLADAIRGRKGRRDLDFDDLGPLIREELPPLLGERDTPFRGGAITELIERAVAQRWRGELGEIRYLASFSLDPLDPTLWGHYGAAETGFASVIRATDGRLDLHSPIPLFSDVRPGKDGVLEVGTYRQVSVALQKVRYQSSPRRYNAFTDLTRFFRYSDAEAHYDYPEELAGRVPSRSEDQLGLVKTLSWRYEREVRAFLPTFDKHPPEVRSVQLAWKHFKGLIFGPRMTPADCSRATIAVVVGRERFRAKISRSQPVMFWQARRVVDRHRFEVQPLGVLADIYSPSRPAILPLSRVEKPVQQQVRRLTNEINAIAS